MYLILLQNYKLWTFYALAIRGRPMWCLVGPIEPPTFVYIKQICICWCKWLRLQPFYYGCPSSNPGRAIIHTLIWEHYPLFTNRQAINFKLYTLCNNFILLTLPIFQLLLTTICISCWGNSIYRTQKRISESRDKHFQINSIWRFYQTIRSDKFQKIILNFFEYNCWRWSEP